MEAFPFVTVAVGCEAFPSAAEGKVAPQAPDEVAGGLSAAVFNPYKRIRLIRPPAGGLFIASFNLWEGRSLFRPPHNKLYGPQGAADCTENAAFSRPLKRSCVTLIENEKTLEKSFPSAIMITNISIYLVLIFV